MLQDQSTWSHARPGEASHGWKTRSIKHPACWILVPLYHLRPVIRLGVWFCQWMPRSETLQASSDTGTQPNLRNVVKRLVEAFNHFFARYICIRHAAKIAYQTHVFLWQFASARALVNGVLVTPIFMMIGSVECGPIVLTRFSTHIIEFIELVHVELEFRLTLLNPILLLYGLLYQVSFSVSH